MLTIKEAISKYKENHKDVEVTFVCELPDRYIMCHDGLGANGWPTIDKESGEEGFIFIFDYAEYVDNNQVKTIKVSDIKE